MELSLKIELTDEQYNELMTKSFDSVFGGKEFTEALQKEILSSIGQYLKDHPNFIQEHLLRNSNYYSSYDNTNSYRVIDRLIEEGSKTYASEISDAVAECYKHYLKKVPLEDILKEVLYKAILEGFTRGMDNWKMESSMHMSTMSSEVEMLKSRLLGNNSY